MSEYISLINITPGEMTEPDFGVRPSLDWHTAQEIVSYYVLFEKEHSLVLSTTPEVYIGWLL